MWCGGWLFYRLVGFLELKMENFKIKVANAAESKEAQELFFELGYGWGYGANMELQNLDKPHIYAYRFTNDITHGSKEYYFTKHANKEITLQQLRDLVVLKRNDVNDATHTDQDDWKWYIGENSYVWGAGNSEQIQRWDKANLDHVDLKPIQEKQVETKLFLDPTQNYAEIEWDGTTLKSDKWIEVPYYMNFAHLDSSGFYFTAKKDEGIPVVWQRTQDNSLPFIDDEPNIDTATGCTLDAIAKTNGYRKRHDGESDHIYREGLKMFVCDMEFIDDKTTALDIQVGGNHYKKMKIQPVEFALANNLDFCQGSAIKCILRHADKNGREDLEKAKHFIDLMIQHYYG